MSPFYCLAYTVCGAALRTIWRMRVVGREHVPLSGPLIVAANHVSYFDPPVIGVAMPRPLFYMAKRQLFEIPIFGAMIGALNAYPVDRERGDTGAIRRTVQTLKQGNAVVLFPEGTRNRDGSARPRPGVALLASLSGAPVLPAHISGTEEVRRFRPVRVVFGEPFFPGEGRKANREDLERWTDEIMGRIHALGERLK